MSLPAVVQDAHSSLSHDRTKSLGRIPSPQGTIQHVRKFPSMNSATRYNNKLRNNNMSWWHFGRRLNFAKTAIIGKAFIFHVAVCEIYRSAILSRNRIVASAGHNFWTHHSGHCVSNAFRSEIVVRACAFKHPRHVSDHTDSWHAACIAHSLHTHTLRIPQFHTLPSDNIIWAWGSVVVKALRC